MQRFKNMFKDFLTFSFLIINYLNFNNEVGSVYQILFIEKSYPCVTASLNEFINLIKRPFICGSNGVYKINQLWYPRTVFLL